MIDERGCWKDQLLPEEVSPNRENEIPTQNRTDDWSVAQGKSSARLLKERPSQVISRNDNTFNILNFSLDEVKNLTSTSDIVVKVREARGNG